ncbi:MAG TPA: VWA domain-containing protein, partial [Euzebya sp.]|nr:VWA domain-containing protein [Euzebya sp.]
LGLWLPAEAPDNQTIDPVAGTVSATVQHFSIFGLFNLAQWLDFWGGQACDRDGGDGGGGDVAVALVIDSSGSMTTNDRNGLRREAAKDFVDLLSDTDQATVIDFDSTAKLFQALTSDKALLKAAIDRIDSSGGTNIGAGVNLGLNQLDTVTDDSVGLAMILLTDGQGSYSSTLTTRAAEAGVQIFTIGLGSGVNQTLLQGIADGTGGRYFPVASAEELADVFRDIGGEVTERDRDGDGLTDCEEVEGIEISSGGGTLTIFSDPDNPDTDEDGLPDGIEVEPFQWADIPLVGGLFPPGATGYSFFSEPNLPDTDGGSLLDPEELQEGTRARSQLTDDDVIDDWSEVISGTNPLLADTDGDGIDDTEEYLDGILDGAPRGLDPRVFDDVTTFGEYSRLYTKGFACGDVAVGVCGDDDRDTLPFLIGQVVSGFSGPVADLRDVIGNIEQGDLVGTVLAGIGLIPLVGDGVKAFDAVSRFIVRNPERTYDVALAMRRLPIPEAFKTRVFGRLFSEADRALLESRHLSPQALDRLVESRVDIEHLARAVRGATNVGDAAVSTSRATQFFADWRGGERFLRTSGALSRGRGFANPVTGGRRNYRIVDAWFPDIGLARESKVGFQHASDRIRRQIDTDAALLANGDFTQVEWHFFASGVSDTIGADPQVIRWLEDADIPYFIHLPS